MARQHALALRRIATPAVVVGLCDSAPGRAMELAAITGSTAYPTIESLLDEGRPEIVHVCTPSGAHFDAAFRALDAGAHVYVEKPFALTVADARSLLGLARERGRLVCAGHQLLRDRAFERLMTGAAGLGTIVQIDSHFTFRPVGPPSARTGPRALASQAVDILPHPLYTLVSALERFAAQGTSIDIAWADGGASDLHAVLRAGDIVGRLSVSLRARPIASFLTVTGTGGALTCDFVRSVVIGAANPGTATLEKILNPIVEGAQMIACTATSLARRLAAGGGGYPGLAELIGAFYAAAADGAESPVSPDHLLRVSTLLEQLVARIEPPAPRAVAAPPRLLVAAPRAVAAAPRDPGPPLVALTGARGFLGAHVARALPRVRALGRSANPDDPHVQEWIVADLSAGVPAGALAGVEVVVHAAAETAGGYEAHQRNTIDATRYLLRAMRDAGVFRLVLVSSLSVLRPPRTSWERQNEDTPRLADPRPFGAYAWGKTRQEELVSEHAAEFGIATRIVRPGALMDWSNPALPGLMGRHLFGRWHLGLGRPGLPIAICDVARCAKAIAWTATDFDSAPAIVNLFDPEVADRRAVIRRLRERGWTGRVVWVPIGAISLALVAARTAMSLARGQRPERLAAWSVLRPRRYDARLAAEVLGGVRSFQP